MQHHPFIEGEFCMAGVRCEKGEIYEKEKIVQNNIHASCACNVMGKCDAKHNKGGD